MIFMSLDKKRYIRKIIGVVEPYLADFLRVLGIDEVYEVKSLDDLKKHIDNIYERNDVAIVVIQRSLAKKLGNIIEKPNLYPVILVLPDRPEYLAEKPIEVYRDIIKRFIGYEVFIGI